MTLNDLFTRAGASDTDREAWLAERRTGITATEVRDLAKAGASKRKELLENKLDPEAATFTGNQFTEWGRTREPVLGDVLRASGIEPESRIFHAAENPRHMASPDGIGFDPISDEIVLGEIKTSRHDLHPDGDHYPSTGYGDQMQWQMHVCGASRCLFVWEQHDNEWPHPTPLPHQAVWVERDQERIDQLVELADGFLAELDGEKAFSEWELTRIRVQAEAMEWHRQKAKLAETKLRALIKGRPLSESLAGKRFEQIKVSYSGDKPKQVTRFDSTAAQDAYPAEWEAFCAAEKAWDDLVRDKFTTTEWKPSTGRLTVKGA